VTIGGEAHALRFATLAAVHPAQWEALAAGLRLLARRVVLACRARRLDRGTRRDLVRLLDAVEAAWVPAAWQAEIGAPAQAIAEVAQLPSTGPVSVGSGPRRARHIP
jgi:hypothetical protein